MRVGLIGHPLGHSLSPPMQDAAFAALGLPYRYELIDIPESALPDQVAALRGGDWLGCNVTVPYKTAIAPLLDELHGDAAALGAVNTVRVEAGRLAGYNTDVAGFAADLAAHLPAGAVVLGAGGSARAVVWALVQQGWEVVVVARRAVQAAQLRDSLPAGGGIIPLFRGMGPIRHRAQGFRTHGAPSGQVARRATVEEEPMRNTSRSRFSHLPWIACTLLAAGTESVYAT